jgi:endonuclease/exonuclease/phosphatase family metal-dependent hydrolase
VSWVKLCCRKHRREFIYVNTHFDYQPEAIINDARCLRHWLDLLGHKVPLIITGDFNAEKDSEAYQLLTANLIDAFRQTHPPKQDEATFHAFGHWQELAALDWILISDHFQVIESEIDRTQKGNLFPSDHYPLTAVLDWKTV